MWEKRKDHDEAERLYRQALRLDRQELSALANLAKCLVSSKAYAEADEMATRALALLDVAMQHADDQRQERRHARKRLLQLLVVRAAKVSCEVPIQRRWPE